MTLVLAIAAKDRIVMAADGKVNDTERGVLNKPKLFPLTNNCVAAVAGMGLKDTIDDFMATLRTDIANKGLSSISSIAEYVKEFANGRTWAEWDDPEKSHMIVLLGGYDGNTPKVYIRLSTGTIEQIRQDRYAIGNWDDAVKYLLEAFEHKDHKKISFRTAEKVAVEMLAKGEAANPAEVGGDGLVWHVLPHRTAVKSTNYAAKLRTKHINQ